MADRSKIREKRPVGLAKGRIDVPESFFDPLPEELLDAFEGDSEITLQRLFETVADRATEDPEFAEELEEIQTLQPKLSSDS